VDSRTRVVGLYLLKGTLLTLAPRSLGFGNQLIKTLSAVKSVTLTNTSPKVVAITSIALTGAASAQFVSTDNCGESLTGHATCTIKVTFKPTTKGAKSASLNVNGGGGGLRTVTLTGTGT
jgi:Abnormal spindle-like microcephaly-assoc'd, ASPM-SPD-2-Hydin